MIDFLDLKAAYAELKTDIDAAYFRVMNSGRWILGPELEAFEKEFSQYCGTRYCAGVASGLDALTIILESLGLGTGDEVIVPSNTFIATWLAITSAGATPVPVEPESGTFNITLDTIKQKLSKNTKAVIVVHLFGEPVNIEPIVDYLDSHDIHLIEDAAQSHGSSRNGHRTGSFGIASAFSFYPGKNLGAFGDGGAIVTNDEVLLKEIRCRRNYGSLIKNEPLCAGKNSRLDELQAAFLRVRLPLADEWDRRRAKIAYLYSSELKNVGDIVVPEPLPGNNSAWHLYVIQTKRRDELKNYLHRKGIETHIHYPAPVYRQPPFQEYGPEKTTYADSLSREILSLPIGPHLTGNDLNKIIDETKNFFTAS